MVGDNLEEKDIKQQVEISQEEPEMSSRQVSFTADADYASSYLKNVYEPDDYHNVNKLLEEFQTNFITIISVNPAYSHLRSIDKSFLRVDDEIIYNGDNKRYFIVAFVQETIKIKGHGAEIEVGMESITPIDEILNKIRPEIFSDLYSNIRKNIDTKYYTETDFFQCFCDYFKCNEKLLYQKLSVTAKERLIKELNNKTGFLNKKGASKSTW